MTFIVCIEANYCISTYSHFQNKNSYSNEHNDIIFRQNSLTLSFFHTYTTYAYHITPSALPQSNHLIHFPCHLPSPTHTAQLPKLTWLRGSRLWPCGAPSHCQMSWGRHWLWQHGGYVRQACRDEHRWCETGPHPFEVFSEFQPTQNETW